MPKRKSILMGVFIIFIIGGITMSYFNRIEEKRTEAQQIQHEQERMALYAYNHYEGIKKIEFLDFEKNHMTGTWSSSVRINDKYDGIFKLLEFDGEIYLIYSLGELTIKEQETNKTDLDGVNVKYYKK